MAAVQVPAVQQLEIQVLLIPAVVVVVQPVQELTLAVRAVLGKFGL